MKSSVASIFTVLFSLSVWAQSPSETHPEVSNSEIPQIEVVADQEVFETSRFPQFPLPSLPLSAQDIEEDEKTEKQIQRLADVTRTDASTSDAYNANGYWDFLNVRGFTLDNRFSYLREGLPINAETSIPLDNKKSIEILKGLSGTQAGASSPGGNVNLNVLRPPVLGSFKKIFSAVNDNGGALLGADLGGRRDQQGYRGMIVYEDLKNPVENSAGHRYLVSYAHDYVLSETTLLQFEIENSRRSQASQASLSLLGTRIPGVRPRVNLNNQPWTTPVVFAATSGTLGLQHRFSSTWQSSFVVGVQDLVNDDRLAYPYGCSAENTFDRYCSDGTFDVYDFRSDSERRRSESAKVTFDWTGSAGAVQHALQFGALASRQRDRFQKQAYNYVGVGTIDGSVILPEDGTLTDENTNRDSEILDLFVFDSLKYHSWGLWLGARSSSIQRSSVRTDGSRATSYQEHFVLPWGALSYEFENVMAYTSYSEGVETFVTPNRNTYADPGRFVDDVRSHQYELGLRDPKGQAWSLAVFEIHRPVVTDSAPHYQVDGKAIHRGIEAQAQTDISAWTLGASTMYLDAQRAQSTLQPEFNGKHPVNVPKTIWRAFADYQVNADFKLSGLFSYEDERAITADNSILLSSWNRWDATASYQWRHMQNTVKAQLFIENVLDAKFWKEAPTQYGHIYLYAGKERNFQLSLSYLF